MTASKRTLAAFAAGALLVPLVASASPAFAQTVDIRTIENACPTNQLPEDPFTDVDEDNTFNDEITCIAEFDVTRGKTATTYDPSGFVIRSQMALFISRILTEAGVELDTSDAGFRDIGQLDQGTRDAINGLANAGVVNGTSPTTFSPRLDIRRDQIASFIAQAQTEGLDREVETSEDFFTDDNDNVHEENINILASEGIAAGRGGEGNFDTRSNTTREQMAAFLARKIDILVEEEFIPARFTGEPAAVEVNDQDEEIEAGDPITGTVTGGNIDTVTVAGDCVDSGEVEDINADTEDFEFSVPTNEDAAAGECDVTFTVTFESGRQQQFTVTVTIADAPQGTNERPELTSAAIVSTTTAGQVTPTNPAGTVVRYTFDEAVLEQGAPPRVGSFFIFDAAGNRLTGDTIVDVEGNSVTVRFNTVDTAEEAANITLATVDVNAVTDADGDVNPEGDAPLGTTSGGGSTPLPAGVTDGPDLVSVGNFRQGASAGQTAVDFTFDEAAFISNPNGFALIEVTEDNGAANDNEERGSAQAAGTPATGTGSQPSGGTVAGGNGTTTITVIFNDDDSDAVLTAADIARATVDANTVSDVQQDADAGTAPTGNTNPLQAVDVSAGGNTDEPDLVSVELRPAATPGGQNSALFVFDQAVTTANGSLFFLYEVDGDEIGGSNARVNTQGDSRQVLVDFATTANIVGGNVRDNAVTAGQTATNLVADNNEQDEVGVAGTSGGTSGRTAGRTAGPDLTGVAISRQASDVFGNPGNFQATYTFDEDVTGEVEGNFFLYLSDGTRLVATTCTTATAEETDNTVTCTAFSTLPDNGSAGTTATSAQIGSAVLGTVDDGAVQSRLADNSGAQAGTATESATNPEGAEPTSGGTGTPSA